MATIEIIDKKLLNIFQSIADWIQKIFGIDNFLASKISLGISICFLACVAECDIIRQRSFFLCFDTAIFLSSMYTAWSIKESEILTKSSPNFMNPYALILKSTRLTWVCTSYIPLIFFLPDIHQFVVDVNAESVGSLAFDLFVTFSIFAVYLTSCTPKPPKKSKLKKLIEKLSFQPVVEMEIQKIQS